MSWGHINLCAPKTLKLSVHPVGFPFIFILSFHKSMPEVNWCDGVTFTILKDFISDGFPIFT